MDIAFSGITFKWHHVMRAGRLLAVAGLTGGFALCAGAQTPPAVLKIGMATINDPQHEWAKLFAAGVEQGSKGRIKVETYPASQLGAIPRMIEGTQFGSIQVFAGPPEFLSGVDTRYEVLSAPGLFKDLAHSHRTLQDPEFNAAFLALGGNKGLKGIGLFINGPANIVTRAPVRKFTDLEGKKVRVLASPLQMEQMRRLKATPVPMSLGEVMPALQQGTLDGMMGGPNFTQFKFYDVAKYMYEPNHATVVTLAVMNRAWFDKLPPELRTVVTQAATKASNDVFQWTVDYVANHRAGWLKAGGEITQPTPAEHAQLMRLLLPIGVEVTSRKPDEKALFDLLLRTAKRTQ